MNLSQLTRKAAVALAASSILFAACNGDSAGEPTDAPATSVATPSSQPDDPTESPPADVTEASAAVDTSQLRVETDFGARVCVSITNPDVPDSVTRCVPRRSNSRIVELAYDDARYLIGINRDGGRVNFPRSCSVTHQAVSQNGRITVDWCEAD